MNGDITSEPPSAAAVDVYTASWLSVFGTADEQVGISITQRKQLLEDRLMAYDKIYCAWDQQLVGIATVDEQSTTLDLLYVLPSVHGTGIGSRLLQTAIDALGDGAMVWVSARNTYAQSFYVQRKWVLTGVTQHYPHCGPDGCIDDHVIQLQWHDIGR